MAKSFSLEEALGGAPKPTAAPSKGFSLEDALAVRPAKVSQEKLGLPAGEDLAALITPAEDQPKSERKVYTGSVFDTQPFDPKFDPVEAEKLSRRAYAEKQQTQPRRTQSVRATPEDQIDRSLGRSAMDAIIQVAQGANAVPQMISANILAGDNPIAEYFKSASEAGERSKSPFLQSQKAEREALLKNVLENQGELAQTRAAFTSMFSPAGADIVVQGAGSILPVVGMSLLGLGQRALAATNALATAGESAQNTARKLSQMSPQDWSKSDAYQELRSSGLSHADAVKMLAPLMAMPSQLVGGGAGFIAGATGLEKSLVGGAIRGGAKERAIRAGSEALGEQVETLAPSLAGNITQRMIDEKTSPTEGLGREAVETLFGSAPGAALAASGRSAPDAKPELDTRGLADRMARERGFLATETKRPEERAAPVQERVEPTFEPEKLAAEPSAPKQPAQEGRDLSDLDAFIAQLQQPAVEPTMEKPAPEVAEVAAPAEETPQEKLKRLSSKSIGMTNAFRDRIITNQEFDKFKSDLEAARQEANQAAPDVSALSPAKQEILEIADKLEAAGVKGVPRGMRLNARPEAREPDEKSMEFYRSKLEPYEEKQAAPEGKPYGLPEFFSDNEKEAARITGLMKSGPLKTRVALGEANDSIQRLAGTIQAAGFDVNNLVPGQVPDGIMKIKSQIGNIAARSNRLAAAAEAVQKKYKRADPARVKADVTELMADVEQANDLLAEDQNIPSAAEQMEGVAPPVSPEVEELLKKSRLASDDIEILSKRSSGTSLMKVLEGALKDGEMSELGGRSRQIGKNPFISLVAKKGKRGSSMEDMVESGKLNLFLPFGKRSGEPGYDNAESAEYIREKLRTGEYYTDDIRQEIESIQRGIWSIDEEIQQELSLEDINREIQYAADEQRAIDQEAETVAPEGAPEALDEGTREEDEILKAQTKEELKAKQDEIDRLSKENDRLSKEAERKAKADEQAGDFVLTGSKREADEAEARGQKPMFSSEGAQGYNIDPEDQRIQKELSGKSMVQVADWLIDNAPNAFAKVIAGKVRNRLQDFQRKGMTLDFVIEGGSTRNSNLRSARGVTQPEWGKDDKGTKFTVMLNGAAVMDNQYGYPPGVKYNTILHELLHVATRSQFVFMPSTDPLQKQMTELFNTVVGQFNADAKAGNLPPVMEKYYKRMNNVLEDPDELLTWGLTDRDVQAYLDDIKVGEKSIFTRLVELIRKALGLGKPYESALERLVRTSESMLDVDVDAIDAMMGQRDKQIGVKKKPAGPMTQESLFQKEGAPAKAPPTDSAAFKRWFGDSKVVDANGRPLVMYHGTNKSENGEAFTRFDTYGSNYGLMGQGSYFTDNAELASSYTKKGRGDAPTVYPVYLSIKNPIDMDARGNETAWKKGFPDVDFDQFRPEGVKNEDYFRAVEEYLTDQEIPRYEGAEIVQNGLLSMGHDGVTHRGGARYKTASGESNTRHQVFIAFDPEQIKSATGNIGTYDPNNPDIRYQREVEEAPKKEPKKLGDTWLLGRDKAGNVGFGPGAKAYSAIANIANTVLDKMAMKPVSPELGRAMRNMKARVDQVQNKIGEVAAEMNKLSKDEREMISDIIEGELKADVHPPQHVLNLAASIQSMMSRQSQELVELGMLSKEAANRWDNKYLPRFYETKLRDEVSAWAKATRDLFKKQPMMRGIKGSQLRARGLFEVIDTKDLPDYLDMGWEQRDPEFNPKTSDSTIVWRDYNRAERENMGEIRDAMFRFVMGYNASQRDIALGRLYKDLAENYASKFPLEGYVQVPETKAEGTQTPRYGKLEGLYVPKEVMDHLSANDEAMANGILKLYRAGLSKWKEGKTVLNPVSHANNVISNLTMAHFAGVSYWDAFKYGGAVKDFVTKSPMVKEAQDVGVFGGSFNNSELVKSMPSELRAMANMTESRLARFGERIWDTLAFTIEAKGTKYGARPVMQWAYEGEDMFFRYLIYRDARGRGMSPEDARDYSQEYIFTYDDLPKGARAVRDYGMPFFSYTYKVVPVLARTALVYPWRYAAPATIAYTANALMYAIAANMGGSDDDWWTTTLYRYMTDEDFRNKAKALESEERKLLPEWMKGQSAILSTPKAIRMGMDEVTKLPMFLDISRIFPGGDLLDANNNAGGVALLQPLTPSNPVLTSLVAMLANRDMFLGKDVVNKTDTDAEKAQKRAAWLWKQITPAISVGNYHFDRAMSTIANMTGEPITIDAGPMGTVSYTGVGKDGLPVQPKHAMLQTMGIKIRPYDLELSRNIEESNRRQAVREIDLQITRINRQESKNVISSEAAQIERDKLLKKRGFISEGLTPEGKPKK
jgi:hypothetical protein